jgi:hypothetical protein
VSLAQHAAPLGADFLAFAVTQWAAAQGYPVTSLYTSHYTSNLLKLGLLKPADAGAFTLAIPAPDDCPLPNFAVEQTGGWVAAILRSPKTYVGARVDACSEATTVGEWAAALSAVSGKTVKTLGIPGGEFFLEGTEIRKMVPEEVYLNYLAFYKKCVLVLRVCSLDSNSSQSVPSRCQEEQGGVPGAVGHKGLASSEQGD